MSECRSCGATVIWAQTESGKWMPLDAVPVVGGTLWLDGKNVKAGKPSETTKAYVSHFATCPQAGRWRK